MVEGPVLILTRVGTGRRAWLNGSFGDYKLVLPHVDAAGFAALKQSTAGVS